MTVDPQQALLRSSGIRKAYGSVPVLRGIDLAVAPHEVVALIGSSGSGKSTLLRTITLLETIDDGQIFLRGVDVSDPAPASTPYVPASVLSSNSSTPSPT